MMHRTADGLQHTPVATPGLVRRARVRRAGTAILAGVAVLALVVDGSAATRTLQNDEAIPPAGQPSPTPRTEISGPSLLDLQAGDTRPLPDSILGGSLYYTSPDRTSTRWDLWSVPVAGGEPTLVVRNASMGVYAPDGQTLAYLDSPRGGWTS